MQLASNIDDQGLAEQIRNGSKDAFNLLYNRYGLKIHQFACSYLKSEQDAEDLVQEVFLKLWNKREKMDSTQNIRAFIFKIAVNIIYDFIRRKNTGQAFLEFLAGDQFWYDTTWHEVVFDDMLSQIRRLVQQMPEQRQKIFIMSKEKGLDNDKIAEKLNLSKRTVENQLYRATSFLKKSFNTGSIPAILFFYLFF